MREAVHVAIGVVQRLIPEPLPREDLRVLDQQAPERDKRAVGLSIAGHGGGPGRKLRIAPLGAIDVDAIAPSRLDAVRTEASEPPAGTRATVVGHENVADRPLPFAAPHEAVDVVGPKVVLDEPQPEVSG